MSFLDQHQLISWSPDNALQHNCKETFTMSPLAEDPAIRHLSTTIRGRNALFRLKLEQNLVVSAKFCLECHPSSLLLKPTGWHGGVNWDRIRAHYGCVLGGYVQTGLCYVLSGFVCISLPHLASRSSTWMLGERKTPACARRETELNICKTVASFLMPQLMFHGRFFHFYSTLFHCVHFHPSSSLPLSPSVFFPLRPTPYNTSTGPVPQNQLFAAQS